MGVIPDVKTQFVLVCYGEKMEEKSQRTGKAKRLFEELSEQEKQFKSIKNTHTCKLKRREKDWKIIDELSGVTQSNS